MPEPMMAGGWTEMTEVTDNSDPYIIDYLYGLKGQVEKAFGSV